MNELRMYVEHLFQGKVLTAENIELKEEIYGNLMARYEDLVAQGVSEAEALRRTKESITSVDDVLAGEEDADPASAHAEVQPAGVQNAGAQDAQAAEPGASVAADPTSLEAATSGPTPPGMGSAPAVSDGQTPMAPVTKRKAWPWIAGACVAVLLVIVLGARLIGGFVVDEVIDEDAQSMQVNGGAEGQSGTVRPTAPQGSTGTSDGGVALDMDDAGVTFDADGTPRIDGERAGEPLTSVADATPSDLTPFLHMAIKKDDATEVTSLLAALPMGVHAVDLDVTRGEDVLAFAFREIPEAYEGDAVDLALAYDATALFCVFPEVNTIEITVTEQDEPNEEDYYTFTRASAEQMYGVSLDRTLIGDAGWVQLKDDNLYQYDFAERLVETASVAWR